jgi:hypothetical protein
MFALEFNSDVYNELRDTHLPISSIDDLTGRDTNSVAVFSDYGPSNTPFQTFGFYVTDFNTSGDLTQILRSIKAKHGISGRTIDFKGRKDRLKRNAFREWIKAVRSWPGLLYIVAIDRGLMNHPSVREMAARRKEEFRRVGLPDFQIYSRIYGALMFLPTLSTYLKEKHRIAWVTDKDSIVDTPARQDILVRTFGRYAERLLNKTLSDIAIIMPGVDDRPEARAYDEHARELISVADVAASALAASLSVDEHNRANLSCLGPEAIDMLQEISKFQDVSDYKIEARLSCPMLVHILMRNRSDGEVDHKLNTMTLTYDFESDPLREEPWGLKDSDIHLEVFRSNP